MIPKEALALPMSVYTVYAEQAVNHLAASTPMGSKFEFELHSDKKKRALSKLEEWKQQNG